MYKIHKKLNCYWVLFLTLALFIVNNSSSHAQNRELGFFGGTLYPTTVDRNDNGSSSVSFSVSTTWEGAEGNVLPTTGIGIKTIDEESKVINEPQYTLTSIQFTKSSYNESSHISSATLDPRVAEDNAYGCFEESVRGTKWVPTINNIDTDNLAFAVKTRYSALVDQSNPAPKFTGDTHYLIAKDQTFVLDLKEYIDFGDTPYSCALKNPSVFTGIAYNPEGLTLSTDCVLTFNPTSYNVGDLLALVIEINSESPAPRADYAPAHWPDCYPKTELAMVLEIGCSQEQSLSDPAGCFLCSETDINPTFEAISNKAEELRDYSKIIKKKIKSLLRKAGIRKFHTDLRAVSPLHRVTRSLNQEIAPTTASITSVNALSNDNIVMQCLAPSPYFCSSSSFISTKSDLLEKASELFAMVDKQTKRITVTGRRTDQQKRAKKIRKKAREDIQNLYEELKALINSLPDSETFCGEDIL